MHACDWCLGCIWLMREPAEHHRTHSVQLNLAKPPLQAVSCGMVAMQPKT
jgi:hypothetical protein